MEIESIFLNFKLIKNFFHLFVYFLLHWVFVAAWTFSSCSMRRLLSSRSAWPSHCLGFSLSSAQALAHMGFSNCGAKAQLPCDMWNLSS